MLEVIYISAAVKPFSQAELTTLLRKARINNTRLGVTGMLLYDRGSFLQVLEGEIADVRSLYEVISKDPRHERVIKLLETTVPNRSFGDWSMGFAAGAQIRASQLEGHNEVLRPDFSEASFLPDRERAKARQVLLAFREGRWRTFVGS
ncbi:MAG TPA: BLUF domain-containing protein [Polyangiaceae bacterium]|nr:BLUF domain-containing protein [Polyangiaceae bacterium]